MFRSWHLRSWGAWLALLAVFTAVLPVHGASALSAAATAADLAPPCHATPGSVSETRDRPSDVQANHPCAFAPDRVGGCHCVQAVAAPVLPVFKAETPHSAVPATPLASPVVSPPLTARFRPPIFPRFG